VTVPSVVLKPGDVIEVREKSRKIGAIARAMEAVDRRGVPGWIDMDKQAMKATLKAKPERAELTMPITEQLIVELYSK
jgi:small subunit ribosomal protein S4